MDAIKNIKKPILNNFTLPNSSDILPKSIMKDESAINIASGTHTISVKLAWNVSPILGTAKDIRLDVNGGRNAAIDVVKRISLLFVFSIMF